MLAVNRNTGCEHSAFVPNFHHNSVDYLAGPWPFPVEPSHTSHPSSCPPIYMISSLLWQYNDSHLYRSPFLGGTHLSKHHHNSPLEPQEHQLIVQVHTEWMQHFEDNCTQAPVFSGQPGQHIADQIRHQLRNHTGLILSFYCEFNSGSVKRPMPGGLCPLQCPPLLPMSIHAWL